MITCKICGQEFAKIITSTHLKKHNITTAEYKDKYGSVACEEYKQSLSAQRSGANNANYGNKMSAESKAAISAKNKGKAAWNKGMPISKEQKQAVSLANTGRTAWNKGGTVTEETRSKIKAARAKQVIKPESVQKAIATKIERGYDLAVFRGKTHSAESRAKISAATTAAMKQRTHQSLIDAQERIAEHGYTLEKIDGNFVTLKHTCNNEFTITRQYLTNSKFKPDLCPHCYSRDYKVSIAEQEIIDFLKQHTVVQTGNRTIISPLELDIVLPDFKIAIEYNGLYWHSEIFKDKQYHARKTELASNAGYTLVHIFEDEWINNRSIVESRLLSMLNKNTRIYARNCSVVELSSNTANAFLKHTHLQGTGRSNVRYGLLHNDTLVAVMTFLHNDISKGVKGWELNRFATSAGINVVGGASKLFKHFISNHSPSTVTTFADRRWSSSSKFYETLGFTFAHTTAPNYWYTMSNEIKRYHRYGLRKPAGTTLTEAELRQQQGYTRIYDCGNNKYIWTNV